MSTDEIDRKFMARAIEIAARGRGVVEPNPMVGCVVVQDGARLGEGWHGRFGGPHAEVNALRDAGKCAGATMYVSLEPCSHHGKTPPCTEAIIGAGIRRIVVALQDPFERVAGSGIEQLESAGLQVELGLMEDEARYLNAPFLKLVQRGRPWAIAKWAMTLDGKIASRTGYSQWISSEASRAVVHQLRGRVDAVMVGSGTAAADNPLLTARPPGPRTATRVVVDSRASLSPDSQLVRTATEVPVLVATSVDAPEKKMQQLSGAGCEIVVCEGETHSDRLEYLLEELGHRRMTNLLVEGGGHLLGNLFDVGEVDEVHVFIACKLVGGAEAPSPIGGRGVAEIGEAMAIADPQVELTGGDLHVHGRTRKNDSAGRHRRSWIRQNSAGS
jgi:diaminohydroxyphosphoribosylaminopyrimidine deaminase/5-amino-6-(5-phosphoribosylamino)uracil reductase